MALSAARLAADSLRALPRKRISRVMGHIAGFKGPRPMVARAIDAFVRYYGVDLNEAEVPPEGFVSFDDFFTRKLKAGTRPIDSNPSVVVSPSDGRLDDCGAVEPDETIWVKGRRYSVAELLDDPDLAAHYEGGRYFIVYLSPRDYHRVHAPVGGHVVQVRYVGGTLFPVNEIGTEHIERLFARNERVSISQQSEHYGLVTTVMVGAIGVGRISLSFDDLETNKGYATGVRRYGPEGHHLKRGDELGVFHLGSTVLVFLPASESWTVAAQAGESLRMGSAVVHGEVR